MNVKQLTSFQVVLVIAQELADAKLNPEVVSKSRLLVAKLVCKLFLTHLHQLLKLEKSFHEMWSSILDCLSKFAKLDPNPNSLLVIFFFERDIFA
jgi:hypothetical protein